MTAALDDLKAGWTLPADTVAFTFADHAVEQVNRRFLRLLDLDQATRQLYRLAAESGKMTRRQPKWLHKPPSRAVAWLLIEDRKMQMAFPLFDGHGDDHVGHAAGSAELPLPLRGSAGGLPRAAR